MTPSLALAGARAGTTGGLHVRRWGDTGAPPVVLLHGFVVSSRSLQPTAEVLAADFDVLAPDLPGFGLSPPRGEAQSVPQLARALAEWVEGVAPPISGLLATSFGCQVASELAMCRPDLAGRLVMVSPALDPTGRRKVAQLRRWWREARTYSPAYRRLVVREYLRVGPCRAAATFRHATADRMEDKLPFVEAPTLVVWGTGDPVVSRPWAEEVARLLPRGRLSVLPGAPHAMAFEAPRILAAAVRRFLRKGAET